jgi:A/G-specific adenine glycosylase
MNTLQNTEIKPMASKADFSTNLLQWYDRHGRVLPWRVTPAKSKAGVLPDPYHVWLSEVMLQQTQVATVREYYLKFLALWPSIHDLAGADSEDVMKAWAGLGYYSRARNLKKCAEMVSTKLDGNFPCSVEGLKELPGIGDYTAAAISAIAFQQTAAVVDGNIERVITRQYSIPDPMLKAKELVREKVAELLPRERPGDFAQAMMDLGASLCSPKKPACSLCPVSTSCSAHLAGNPESFPVKLPKAVKPLRHGAAFVIMNSKGEVYLQKRADKGLLGGMSEIPGTLWTARIDGMTGKKALPFSAEWKRCGIAKHTFTHFHLQLEVWQVTHHERETTLETGWWVSQDQLMNEALPTVMKKAISVALPDAFKD